MFYLIFDHDILTLFINMCVISSSHDVRLLLVLLNFLKNQSTKIHMDMFVPNYIHMIMYVMECSR